MDENKEIVFEGSVGESVGQKPKYPFGRLYGKMSWLFFAVVMLIVCANICAAVLAMIANFYKPEIIEDSRYALVVSGIAMYAVGSPIAIIMLLFSTPRQSIGERKKIGFGSWMKYLCIAFMFMLAGNLVGIAITGGIGIALGRPITNPVADMLGGGSWIIVFVTTVIAAPIFEEIIFRKLLIDRMGSFGEKTAIIASALAFGLVHGNFSQFFYAFGVGLLFGYVYCKTKNIWYTIAMHMVINGVSGVLTAYISDKIDTDAIAAVSDKMAKATSDEEIMRLFGELMRCSAPMFALLGVMLVIFVLAILGIVFLARGAKNVRLEECVYDIPKKKIRVATYLNVGVIFLYVIMAISFIGSLA